MMQRSTAMGADDDSPRGAGHGKGDRVLGRFSLERLLRVDLLVSVHLGRDEDRDGKPCLVWSVHPGAVGRADKGARPFRSVIEQVQGILHPSLPLIVAAEDEPGTPVVVAERPAGRSLRDLIDTGELPSAHDAARLVSRVAGALEVLHAEVPSVLHRGVSPERVLVDPRLSSVWLEEAGYLHALVVSGRVTDRAVSDLARPGYVVPDELAFPPGPPADVFALSVLAYELLTGRLPFGPVRPSEISKALRAPELPQASAYRSTLNAAVDAVFERAWGVSRGDHYAAAAAFARDLLRAIDPDDSSRPTMPGVAATSVALASAGMAGPIPESNRATRPVATPRPPPDRSSSRSLSIRATEGMKSSAPPSPSPASKPWVGAEGSALDDLLDAAFPSVSTASDAKPQTLGADVIANPVGERPAATTRGRVPRAGPSGAALGRPVVELPASKRTLRGFVPAANDVRLDRAPLVPRAPLLPKSLAHLSQSAAEELTPTVAYATLGIELGDAEPLDESDLEALEEDEVETRTQPTRSRATKVGPAQPPAQASTQALASVPVAPKPPSAAPPAATVEPSPDRTDEVADLTDEVQLSEEPSVEPSPPKPEATPEPAAVHPAPVSVEEPAASVEPEAPAKREGSELEVTLEPATPEGENAVARIGASGSGDDSDLEMDLDAATAEVSARDLPPSREAGVLAEPLDEPVLTLRVPRTSPRPQAPLSVVDDGDKTAVRSDRAPRPQRAFDGDETTRPATVVPARSGRTIAPAAPRGPSSQPAPTGGTPSRPAAASVSGPPASSQGQHPHRASSPLVSSDRPSGPGPLRGSTPSPLMNPGLKPAMATPRPPPGLSNRTPVPHPTTSAPPARISSPLISDSMPAIPPPARVPATQVVYLSEPPASLIAANKALLQATRLLAGATVLASVMSAIGLVYAAHSVDRVLLAASQRRAPVERPRPPPAPSPPSSSTPVATPPVPVPVPPSSPTATVTPPPSAAPAPAPSPPVTTPPAVAPPTPAPPAAPAANAPVEASPELRAQLWGQLRGGVADCTTGLPSRSVVLALRIDGRSGRIAGYMLRPTPEDPAVGSCLDDVTRPVRVAPFAGQASLRITFPVAR